MVRAVKIGMKKQDVARVFDVSRKTVWKWCKRICKKGWPNYRDRSKRPHTTYSKVDPYVENAIIILRDSFQWGTQRIKVYLEFPPDYIRFLLENVLGIKWFPVNLSRETINTVLKKHKRNGSPYGEKRKWNQNSHAFTILRPNPRQAIVLISAHGLERADCMRPLD